MIFMVSVALALEGPGSATPCALCTRFYAEVWIDLKIEDRYDAIILKIDLKNWNKHNYELLKTLFVGPLLVPASLQIALLQPKVDR